MKKIWYICALCVVMPFYMRAICPLCAVAVGAGVGLSRWLGVPIFVMSVWLGAFALTVSWWLVMFLQKRLLTFFGYTFFVPMGIYALMLASVWWYAALSWIGMKMLMLGMLIGSSLLFVGLVLHCVLKRWNNNKSFIYFQKVLVPLVVLMLVSLVLYVIKE